MALFINYLELFFNFIQITDTNFIFFVFEKNYYYYVIILYKHIYILYYIISNIS